MQEWHPCNPRGPQGCAQDGGIVQTVFFQQIRVDAPGFVVLVVPVVSFGGQCHWQCAATHHTTVYVRGSPGAQRYIHDDSMENTHTAMPCLE